MTSAIALAFIALLATGGMFGYFLFWMNERIYALAAISHEAAIGVLQLAMMSQGPAFGRIFFYAAPIALFLAYLRARKVAGAWVALPFLIAGCLFVGGCILPTVWLHEDLSVALQFADVLKPATALQDLVAKNASKWRLWNLVRLDSAGLAMVLTGYGILALARRLR